MPVAFLPLLAAALLSPDASAQNEAVATPVQESLERLHYYGPGGRGDFTIDEMAVFIVAYPDSTHMVLSDGWPGWKPWQDVPALVERVRVATAEASQTPQVPLTPPPAVMPVQKTVPATAPPVAESVPAEATPVPAPEVRTQGLGATLGGEVWFNFANTLYANALRAGEGLPTLGHNASNFNIRRARLRADVTLSEWVSGRLNVDFSQDFSSSTYNLNESTHLTLSVPDAPDTWGILVKDAYVDIGGTSEHRLRVGLQKPIIGTMDYYDDFEAYFLGGENAYKAPVWRGGQADSRDLGVAYRYEREKLGSIEVQAINGTGDTVEEDNISKDFLGRVRIGPVEWIEVQASGQYGRVGQGGQVPRMLADVSIEGKTPGPRVIAEGFMGSEGEGNAATVFRGMGATGAWDIGLKTNWFDHTTVLARYMFSDPQVDSPILDNLGLVNGAAFLYWRTAPKRTLATGFTYELEIPENAESDLVHRGIVQTIWKY